MVYRASGVVGSREVAGAHEELTCDLTAGKSKRLLEEFHPIWFVQRMVRIQPCRKGAALSLKSLDRLRIAYGGINLQAIPDDPRIIKKTYPVLFTV